jgi:N-methylhydantoinase A
VIGELPSLPQEANLAGGPPVAPCGHRRIYLGGWRDVPIFAFGELAPGQAIDGPAIIESVTTTVLLRAGDHAKTTAFGWLDIEVGALR